MMEAKDETIEIVRDTYNRAYEKGKKAGMQEVVDLIRENQTLDSEWLMDELVILGTHKTNKRTGSVLPEVAWEDWWQNFLKGKGLK